MRRDQLLIQFFHRRAQALRLVHVHRSNATWNGAMDCGQMMPCSSWFCSMAAATMRDTPMP